jgi:hypothetical protein
VPQGFRCGDTAVSDSLLSDGGILFRIDHFLQNLSPPHCAVELVYYVDYKLKVGNSCPPQLESGIAQFHWRRRGNRLKWR